MSANKNQRLFDPFGEFHGRKENANTKIFRSKTIIELRNRTTASCILYLQKINSHQCFLPFSRSLYVLFVWMRWNIQTRIEINLLSWVSVKLNGDLVSEHWTPMNLRPNVHTFKMWINDEKIARCFLNVTDHFNWVLFIESMSMTTGNRAYNNMKITCKIIVIKPKFTL